MSKIKSSEILEKLIYNSQVAMAQEDNNYNNAIVDIIKNIDNVPNWKSILEVVNINNEYMRMVYIKSVIMTLINCGLIDNDVNINNLSVTNELLNRVVKMACEDLNS